MRSLLGSCLLLAACTADSEDVRPREQELTFPTGIVVAPNDTVAFVASANSELRYDSGTVTVIDLESVQRTITDWNLASTYPNELCGDDNEPCCEPDFNFRETLTCDESLFIRSGAGVRIGNFATDIAVQKLDDPGLRLFIPTRGDPSIAWAEWDDTRLSCSSGGEFALCDDEHRLSFVENNADLQGLGEEPFGVFADSAGEFAMVTHMSSLAGSPQVTLIDSPKSGPARISDMLSGVFAADPSTGLRGATGIVGRNPNQPDDIVYVGSRSEDRIQTFTVGRPVNGAPPFLLPGGWFFLDTVGNNNSSNGASNDTRGMQMSPDGSRLYLVNRKPPSLQIFDTSIGPTGVPYNRGVGATDICRQASTVAVSGSGDAERAYVTCFQDGQLYVVDPRGSVGVEDIVLVGRGPYGVSAARSRDLLLVTNFLEDTIAVVDIAPGSATRNRVVLRIGKPRPL